MGLRFKIKAFSFYLFFLFFFLFTSSIPVHALVDMRNANYLESWIDMSLTGTGFNLKIKRAYNSRCLENGIFGYGWCSELESSLKVTAEGGLKITECGCGLETYYNKKGYDPEGSQKTVEKIMKVVKERNKNLKSSYFVKLRKEIVSDKTLREEFVRQLGLEGEIQGGVLYFSHRGGNDSLTLKGSYYLRALPNGSFQRYSVKTGKLIALYDKNQNFIKISYKNIGQEKVISQLLDNDGNQFNFSYKGDKISKIKGPGNRVAEYKHKKEDLVWVKNAKGEVFSYFYDNLHNMTKILFSDGTSKKIYYNKNKDWVIGFKDRKNCKENYKYITHSKDPVHRYSSKVVKKCNGKVVNKSHYQFTYKKYKNRSGRYLSKASVNNNGVEISTTYHPRFGKPSVVIRGQKKTEYVYYKNGFLKQKKTPHTFINFSYNNVCRKVSTMRASYFESAFRRKASMKKPKPHQNKIVKRVKTDMFYNQKKCQLVLVRNSEGQEIKVRHDRKGRVSFLKDQAEREVQIKYNDILDKPSVIHRPGLGTIRIHYKSNGEVKNVESKKGPVVAAQVASVLSHLMDVITPVASNIIL